VGKGEALEKVDWDRWTDTSGAPAVENEFDDAYAVQATTLAARCTPEESATLAASDIAGWSAQQVMHFLDTCGATSGGFAHSTLEHMAKAYSLTDSRNAEIRFRWYMLCVKSEYTTEQGMVSFLREQGRMKFVRPLYRAMHGSKEFKSLAASTFQGARHQYHAIAAKMLAKDLELE